MRPSPPPDAVLRAFGATEPPVLMAGGLGGAWRSGGLVLKASAQPAVWHDWEASVLAAVRTGGVRVQRARRSRDGAPVVDGWVARDFITGTRMPGRWREIIEAADTFHAALAALPADVVLPIPDERTDPWAIADRVAWDELPVPREASGDAALRELLDARRAVSLPSQLIHGDLTGNVLFADGLAPGVIDFSPYWRPSAYAIGVIVADAVVWEGADLALLDRVAGRPGMGQCLLRSLIFRSVSALLLPGGGVPTDDAAQRYRHLSRAAITLAAR